MEIEMRRKKQALPKAECDAVLSRCTSGVLALAGADGKPYAVPLSYVYANGKLYFHCAASGRKLEMLRQNPQASFCVVDSDEVVPEQFTHALPQCDCVRFPARIDGGRGEARVY